MCKKYIKFKKIGSQANFLTEKTKKCSKLEKSFKNTLNKNET